MTRPRWLRFDSILGRSVLLLVAVVVVAQVLNVLVLAVLVLRPQIQRVSGLLAHNVATTAKTMNELPPAQQTEFVQRLSANPYLQFHRDGEPPAAQPGFPNVMEAAFMRALETQLKDDPRFSWRKDGAGRLWVSITLAGERYWISSAPPKTLQPELALAIVTLVVLGVALAAGIFAQNHIARPLAQLSRAAANVSLNSRPQTLAMGSLSEVRDLEDSFNRMTARLAAAERDREVMLAGVSHDLRTPLAKIRLASEMIGDNDADLKSTIARQVEALDAMLGQFLDFARGHDTETAVDCDLNEFVADVLLTHGDGRFDLRTPVPISHRVRPETLKRALANLLINAVKYGRAPFRVETGIVAGRPFIRVCDHGPGIPDAQRAAMMEPFARGDLARGGQAGSGLGLAIVARIAQAHGGSLDFEDTADGGFAARITLGAPHADGVRG
jgi:two-component system, OmpR family, osmolarity sensor histidine kinase EnvZ